MKKLKELALDETFEIFVLLKNADVRVAKNGKKFIAFTFQDTSGSIDGKFWDASEDEISRFQVGRVVLLGGKREAYQNAPQIKILHMRLATETEPSSPSLYMEKAPMTREEMEEEFSTAIFEITNATWNRIVRYLYGEYQQDFYEFPAAKKNHHAFAGGLAFHTVSMLRMAKGVAQLYPEINRSLLYAGTILHDLGKVIELSGPVATEYTLAGNLLGHLVIVDEEITKACQVLKIDDRSEDVLLLKHMILSHHGLLEYGSPVRPQILEAEILHQLDNLDASIQMILGALRSVEPGERTERIFGLDNRNFYSPHFKE